MSEAARTKRRALLAALVFLVAVTVWKVFYFQELFFAFLLFAIGFLLLLLAAGLLYSLWFAYSRTVLYLASRAVDEGHHAIPQLRILILWLAPTVTRTAAAVSAAQQALLYPFRDLKRSWMRSLQLDAVQFRSDAERAAKHLRLLLRQS